MVTDPTRSVGMVAMRAMRSPAPRPVTIAAGPSIRQSPRARNSTGTSAPLSGTSRSGAPLSPSSAMTNRPSAAVIRTTPGASHVSGRVPREAAAPIVECIVERRQEILTEQCRAHRGRAAPGARRGRRPRGSRHVHFRADAIATDARAARRDAFRSRRWSRPRTSRRRAPRAPAPGRRRRCDRAAPVSTMNLNGPAPFTRTSTTTPPRSSMVSGTAGRARSAAAAGITDNLTNTARTRDMRMGTSTATVRPRGPGVVRGR